MDVEHITVGIVGVGTMGSAMAEVLRPHHRLVVRDLDDAAAERQQAAGAVVAARSDELADRADVVLLSLPGPEDVRDVVEGGAGLLAADSVPVVIVDLSTVDPTTTRAMAGVAAGRGAGYLDAPVLGRPHRCGAWTLPVGGPADLLTRVEPVLRPLASSIRRVGDHGSGNIVKLLNNLMFGAINAITAETMAAAGRLGLDPEVYWTTLADSGAASVSNLFREIAPKMVAADWSPAFTIDLLAKDNRLAVDMIEQLGLEPGVAGAVVELNTSGQAAGLGRVDTSALVRVLRERPSPEK